MHRRAFLASLAALTGAACEYWPEDGLTNPCENAELPEVLARHDLVAAAWEGLRAERIWDCHVHLLGAGETGSGAWINPEMRSALHPIQRTQYRFFMNAACVTDAERVDQQYLARLLACHAELPEGARLMLLAFDYAYDATGERLGEQSQLHVPNDYARDVVRRFPGKLEWVASIHPYRRDAVAALEAAAREGARAVKWLPAAMGMDPASSLCDPFYEALARLGLPLLTHGGTERAVHGVGEQDLGNPLRLRRALDHGARVIVAHCASLGEGVDLDRGPSGPRVENFELFARLMDEPRYEQLLLGDVSAMPQTNRAGPALAAVLERSEWHPRLVNGSDYPLPGVYPLFSMGLLTERGYITAAQADVMRRLRPHNPLVFDLVLKRALRWRGRGFGAEVFETRRVFAPT